jgi:hypothetical protein
MRLVEQGKVDLHAPVRKYLPDFRVRDEAASRDVTVWHLVTHLGGWEGQVSGPDRGTETLKTFVESITDLMQVAPPGAAWSYNNAGFSIAGRVIEAVTGTPINRARGNNPWRIHRAAVRGRPLHAKWDGNPPASIRAVIQCHRRGSRTVHH